MQDNNGFISQSDLRRTMDALGENVSDEEVKEMIDEADLNGDGKVDFEGVTILNKQDNFDQLFTSHK